jgi:hypothetical protein
LAHWLRIDPELIEEKRTETAFGGRTSLSVSPYEIPEAIKGEFDSAAKSIVLEFKYIDDEPCISFKQGPNVTVDLGRNSRRMQRIRLGVAGADRPLESVTTAITRFEDENPGANVRNCEILVDVLTHEWDRLMRFRS